MPIDACRAAIARFRAACESDQLVVDGPYEVFVDRIGLLEGLTFPLL
jgi:hypothetical protein